MRVHTAFWSSMSLWWVVIACAACNSNAQLGSACPGGVCPAQSAVQAPACFASAYVGEIALGEGSDELCLPRGLPTDDAGRAQCEVTWRLPMPEIPESGDLPSRCIGRDFLTSRGYPDYELCVVRHLTSAQRAAGEEGWYYDSDETHPCGVIGAIRFTDGAQAPVGTTAMFRCGLLEARDEAGDLQPIAAEECASAPSEIDASSVGAACLPSLIPSGGFDPRDAYLEIGAPECETGTCMVFRFEGDPTMTDCESTIDGPPCPSPTDVELSIYCSCRCDLPEGVTGEVCDCPDRFTCIELYPDGADSVRGSYCVRKDSVSESAR